MERASDEDLASPPVPDLSSISVPDVAATSPPKVQTMPNVQVHLSSPTKVNEPKLQFFCKQFDVEESKLEDIRLYHAPTTKQSNDSASNADSIMIDLNDICEGNTSSNPNNEGGYFILQLQRQKRFFRHAPTPSRILVRRLEMIRFNSPIILFQLFEDNTWGLCQQPQSFDSCKNGLPWLCTLVPPVVLSLQFFVKLWDGSKVHNHGECTEEGQVSFYE